MSGEHDTTETCEGMAIPEVALEDAGPSHEIMTAIFGMNRNNFRRTIWQEVLDERGRQLRKWGDQTRELGSHESYKAIADRMRESCQAAADAGVCSWRLVAIEEFWEAFAETERDAFRKEAVQTIAVLVSALEDLYRDEFES